MSGNVSKLEELGQCSELIGSIARAMALVAPKMTTAARQSWIGLPPADFAGVLEKLVFLSVDEPEEHLIDLDAAPFVPDGWAVLPDEEQLPNKVRGMFKWNAANVSLYLDKGQKSGKVINGNKLRTELAKKSVFNANVLDYLLANPHLIPEEWKGEFVFFWGTVYRDRGGSLCVRHLDWNGDRWNSNFSWLVIDWDDDFPALVDAS